MAEAGRRQDLVGRTMLAAGAESADRLARARGSRKPPGSSGFRIGCDGGDDRIRTGGGGFAGLSSTSLGVRRSPRTIEIADSFPHLFAHVRARPPGLLSRLLSGAVGRSQLASRRCADPLAPRRALTPTAPLGCRLLGRSLLRGHRRRSFRCCGSPAGRVFQDEGDEHVHAVSRDFALRDLDLLLLHPSAADVAQRLVRAPYPLPDRLFKAPRGLRRDLRYSCHRHRMPPMLEVRARGSWKVAIVPPWSSPRVTVGR